MTIQFDNNIQVDFGPDTARRDPFLQPGISIPNEDIPTTVITIAEAYARLFLEDLEADSDGICIRNPNWNDMWSRILEMALHKAPASNGSGAIRPNAERTAVALIRRGVPSSAVKATYQSVTVTLPKGKYRLYRETSGFGTGAFRILCPGDSGILRPGISSEALAELILALEEAMPHVAEVTERMREGVRDAETRRMARLKAEQIEQTTVRRLLEETLVPMDIDCGFEVRDGVVRLSLSRTLKGSVEIPIEQLGAFLSDTARVESALTPEKAEAPAAFVRGTGRSRHFFPGTPGKGWIL